MKKNVTLNEAVSEERGQTALREAYLSARAEVTVNRIKAAKDEAEIMKAVNSYDVSKSYMKKKWREAHGGKNDIELLKSDIEHVLSMRIYFAKLEKIEME